MVAERAMAGILGELCLCELLVVGWWLNELVRLFVYESVLVVCACMWKVKKRERESGDGDEWVKEKGLIPTRAVAKSTK